MLCKTELISFHISDLLELLGSAHDDPFGTITIEGESERVELPLEGLCFVVKLKSKE